MLQDMQIKGIVRVTVKEQDGTVVSQQYHNLVTNYMKNSICGWLSNTQTTSSTLYPTKIQAGNGFPPYPSTGPDPSDTVLWSPIGGTLKTCDSVMVSQGYYAQYNLTYQTTDPVGAYTELGLFDANNTMWAHVYINQYKSATQTLSVQWMIYTVPDGTNSNCTVTNYARTAIAKWLTGTSNIPGTGAVVPPSSIQLGTGTGILQSSDIALWTPAASTSKSCSLYTVSGYGIQFATSYTATDPNGNYTEAGLFDTVGNIWVHGRIGANKSGTNILSVFGTVVLSN